jgi:hypothetical protein
MNTTTEETKPVTKRPGLLNPRRYVTLELAELCTGYTVRAMQSKIGRGDWIENREYVRAPDGRLLVDLEGYDRWVQQKKG